MTLMLMPVALVFTEKAYRMLAQSLGEAGQYYIFYEYILVVVCTGFALFQIDFFLKNVMGRSSRYN